MDVEDTWSGDWTTTRQILKPGTNCSASKQGPSTYIGRRPTATCRPDIARSQEAFRAEIGKPAGPEPTTPDFLGRKTPGTEAIEPSASSMSLKRMSESTTDDQSRGLQEGQPSDNALSAPDQGERNGDTRTNGATGAQISLDPGTQENPSLTRFITVSGAAEIPVPNPFQGSAGTPEAAGRPHLRQGWRTAPAIPDCVARPRNLGPRRCHRSGRSRSNHHRAGCRFRAKRPTLAKLSSERTLSPIWQGRENLRLPRPPKRRQR